MISQPPLPDPAAPRFVRVRVHEHSGTIILQRPEKRNALSRRMVQDIRTAFGDLHQEKRVRSIILTASDPVFCAGTDLAEIQESSNSDNPQAQWFEDVNQFRELLDTMLRFPKPIIAALNGPVLGSGAALVLASDIAVAAPTADFSLPEAKRGLVAGMVAPLLSFRIGAGATAELLLRGNSLDANQALQRGIYHQIESHELLWAKAHEMSGEISEGAAESLLMTKRVLNETVGEQLSVMLSSGAAATATARTTEAAVEGIAAFLEKRPPNWP